MANQEATSPPIMGWQAALNAERSRIARRTLPIMLGVTVAVLVFFIGAYFWLGQPWQWVWMILEILQAIVLFALAYVLVRRGRTTAAVYLTMLAINVTVIVGPALVEGMILPGLLAGIIAIIFARLLAGRRENRVVTLVSGLAIVIGITLSGLRIFEMLPIPTWVQLITTITAALTVIPLIALILESRDRRYEDSLAQVERYAGELDVQQGILAERTKSLERRAQYLEATAVVARDVTTVLDLQDLLTHVVNQISSHFGFYHAGIFLLDPTGEWAVLRAASSSGGQRMLERGHRLRVGVEGIVGYVVGTGQPRIALDVGADAVFFDNPDLPETRSEIALPLRARGQTIGALDVQSTEPAAFTAEDVTVLQALADQVAVAISNARLFRQAHEALEATRRAYGEISRQAWTEMLRAQPSRGYRYSAQGVVPIEAGTELPSTDGDLPALRLPVQYRGQVLGILQAHKRAGSGDWTPEERALLETLTEQLSLALESARLYQDSRRRAVRERLIGEVTARMRETLDIDTVLQTAAQEVRQALGLPALVVRLMPPETYGKAGDENPATGGPHD